MFSSQLYWHFRASMCAAPPHQHWSGTWSPKLHNSWLVVTWDWIVYRKKRRCGIAAATDQWLKCSVTFSFKTVSCISHLESRPCKLPQLTGLKKIKISHIFLFLQKHDWQAACQSTVSPQSLKIQVWESWAVIHSIATIFVQKSTIIVSFSQMH